MTSCGLSLRNMLLGTNGDHFEMVKMRFILISIAMMVGGCNTTATAVPPGGEPVSQVVNELKQELKLFADTPPNIPHQQNPAKVVCGGVNGGAVVSVVPTNAILILKVTATNIYDANLSVKIPAGSIITVNPSFSGTYRTNGTQALTLDLDIQHHRSVAELQSDIDTIGKRIEFLKKSEKIYIQGKHKSTIDANFSGAIASANADLENRYVLLRQSIAPVGKTEYGHADSDQPPAALKEHTLAATLWTLRQNLLNIDHAQLPCVRPSQLKTEVDFEVINGKKGGVGIDVKIVSIGAGVEMKRDSVQNLIITFDMAGGTSTLLNTPFEFPK
ncbi:hypothetical protein [Cupriavidus sp. D39]|uniref:hypothetical protein n=1 Tax=Cupriavidus sp. D39 TaxID=2997877 RepID=UPI002271C427|nr:hypothetical protein [Cupriavidus sp. D39]MCY0854041.1 hypothetical protein [Cupriavidus sp. D39]